MRTYQPLHLPDGSPNPRFRPRNHPRVGEEGYCKRRSGKGGRHTHRPRSSYTPRPALFESGQFVAWDGEGYTAANGEHRYWYMANSLGMELTDERGISSAAALRFLLEGAQRAGPHAIHVCYGASYDVNMLLRDLKREQVEQLWKLGFSDYLDFELSYRPRKEFTVGPRRRGVYDAPRKVKGNSLTLWDVFGFFQGRFVDALERYLGADYPDLPLIREQKARRSQFKVDELEGVRTYCQAELRALVALMERLRAHLSQAQLPIKRWDGAGAIAASLLEREGVKAHIAEVPEEVAIAAQHAYAGGRMELARYGYHAGAVYTHDINSAYPAAACELPSLVGGEWVHLGSLGSLLLPHDSPFALLRVRFNLESQHNLYPLWWRGHDGSIYFPPAGEGWYWWPEVEQALRSLEMGVIEGSLDILDGWEFIDSGERPFNFIPALYEQRQRWQMEGAGAEKVLKIGLASLYGKTAQRLGSKYGPPPYHCLSWAGYITARTRARLWELSSPDLGAVIFYATDGVFSSKRLLRSCEGGLGEWETGSRQGGLFVAAGVYWTDLAAEEVREKRRGYDEGSVSPDLVMRAYRKRQHLIKAESTRFVTMGSALTSDQQWAWWRRWRTIDRDLPLDAEGQVKRMDIGPGGRPAWGRYPPANGLVPTLATPAPEQTLSHPYPLGAWVEQVIDGVDVREYEAEQMESES